MSNQKRDNSVAWTILIILVVVVFVIIIFGGIFSSMSKHVIEIASTSTTTNKNSSSTGVQNNTYKQGEEQIYKIDDNIQNTNIINKNFGEGMISELKQLGFTNEEATEIQSIFYKIGINSISNIQEGAGDGIDKLQSFVAYANNDTKKKFYFTVEKRKMFYAGFMDATLYDTSKGGILKNINDVHIPETKVDMNTYTTLQVKAEEAVRQYLNYPNTASFPLYDGWGVARNDNNYKIYGKVKAQNGFGATSNMSFSVWFKKENNKYIVEAITLDGIRVK